MSAGIDHLLVKSRSNSMGAALGDRLAAVSDIIHDLDVDVPEGLPEPPLWKVFVLPVRQRKVTKGGILLADETMDVQNWTHQLFKVAAVGKQVYRGKAYETYDIDDADRPKVGELWIVDPKQPRRFGFRGHTIIIINDDQLLGRVDPSQVEHLKFSGFEL
jgi:co-chaperonin GroES (HSP10)